MTVGVANRVRALAIVLCLAVAGVAAAGPARAGDVSGVVKWCDQLAALLADGQGGPAGQLLADRFQADHKGERALFDPAAIQAFIAAVNRGHERSYGFERVEDLQLGESIYRASYLIRYAARVGVVRLWFYQREASYKIANIAFDKVPVQEVEQLLR